jgi:hypothetical protein
MRIRGGFILWPVGADALAGFLVCGRINGVTSTCVLNRELIAQTLVRAISTLNQNLCEYESDEDLSYSGEGRLACLKRCELWEQALGGG